MNEYVEKFIGTILIQDELFQINFIKENIINNIKLIHPLVDNLFHLIINKNLNKELILLLDKLYDICWVQLHTGHWSEVSNDWRSLFSLCCFLIVIFTIHNNKQVIGNSEEEIKNIDELKSLIKKCDEGLMMGDDSYRSYLHGIVDEIHKELISLKGIPKLTNLEDNNLGDNLSPKLKKKKINLDSIIQNNNFLNQIILQKDKLIPIVDKNISIQEFKLKYFDKQIPCIIKGAAKDWSAFTKWKDLNYLLENAAYRTVPIEIGKYYTSDDWSQQLIPFHEYLDKFLLYNNKNLNSDFNGKQEEHDKTTVSASIGYLAQHPLFEQIHSLRKDIQEPIYCILGKEGNLISVNSWFGPSGTISPLHTDPYDNILVQIIGFKYIRVYHPDETCNLYKRKTGLLSSNTSEIDNLFISQKDKHLQQELLETFPLVKNCECYWEGILEEGDYLYIPKLYWHYVQSLSISFSVSFWFE